MLNRQTPQTRRLHRRLQLALCGLALLGGVAQAQTPAAAPAPAPVRLRGVIQSVDLPRITVKERSGETLTLTLADGAGVQEALPIALSAIQPGSFIGTAAVAQPDGRLQALEVVVFPEAARGTGEGHYPWDLQPQSSMTNATVADLAQSPQGRELTLRYKDGEKRVLVPEGVPVVTFKPGDNTLLVAGAKVFIVAVQRNGVPTATRLIVGRNGFQPPM